MRRVAGFVEAAEWLEKLDGDIGDFHPVLPRLFYTILFSSGTFVREPHIVGKILFSTRARFIKRQSYNKVKK